MGDFVADTSLEYLDCPDPRGPGRRYRAVLSPDWDVWGPMGGYLAAIAMRAIGATSAWQRPASFQCLFLTIARFGPVEIEVVPVRCGRRAQALAVSMSQEGRPIFAAWGWTVAPDLPGLVHSHVTMPHVPLASAVQSYAERADDYAAWPRLWRTIDGKPVTWSDAPAPPVWRAWMRLLETPDLSDPFLDAARSLIWLDMMMWNAAEQPHLPWPMPFVAPNLDLAVTFHAGAPKEEWLLCDSAAPVGREGLIGCNGRLFASDGTLIASATSTLFCRPSAAVEGERARRVEKDCEPRSLTVSM
jgi:acyl-CoA thioesterase